MVSVLGGVVRLVAGRGAGSVLALVALLLARSAAAAEPAEAPVWHRSVEISLVVRIDGTADAVETWSTRADTTSMAHAVAQQSFSWSADHEDVRVLEAFTLKAGGGSLPVGPGALMQQAVRTSGSAPQFTAAQARTLVFPAVAAGDTVQYRLARQSRAAMFPGAFMTTLLLGERPHLEAATVSVTLPPGMALLVAPRGMNEQEAETLPDGGLVRRWALDAAAWGGVSLDMSTLPGFEALGEAYAERAAPRAVPTPAIAALAGRLTEQAGREDTRAATLLLYRFVATDIRYVASFQGDGRVVPRAPETVLAEGWGDCKDHTALLQALLAARGIGSVPALIGLRPEPELWGAPGLGQLNHVITYVPSLDLYLDSTAPYAPFGLLPLGEYDKPVVLAEPGRARLARTPARPPEPLVLRTVTAARIGADDVVSGTTTTEASGPQAIALRSMAAWFEGRGRGAASGQMRLLGTPGTGAFRFDPPDRAADEPGYRVHARFRLEEALLDGGEAPFVLPSGLGAFERPGRVLLGASEGGALCLPGTETEELALTLPEGATLGPLPKPVRVEAGSGDAGRARYESAYALEGDVLRVRRSFSVEATRVFCGAEAHAAMRGVAAAARRDQRVQVRLVRSAPASED